ncbi:MULTISPECIES: hypothetical protein [unclassified Sphingobacterium]|jgi:hypothetical protein|uniref:hypothetical protein n=1 Tax=unclassified Sphingobacterium TaxID=2609468 RepID=UPI0010501123|nr:MULTISPECIES: hypothetical protein [unclassified Sphingobacterium]MBB2950968.1 hypothetical protein [Sphingobacterium sp. JUb56]MCS3552501.1 hypothetical protein [Sphingobacterium sp. JUb21]NJI72527.1 hypothetical protein [Sphingobacterium sp. B16(2022)]TCR10737.1 hypothetical protein EDF66_101552 [Sphingobacterium sp. JUb20]
MRVYAILRKNDFSPNHVNNDTAIFQAVIGLLEKEGVNITQVTEDDFLSLKGYQKEPIITMGRSKALVRYLQELERNGVLIINSSFGIQSCYRTIMTEKLLENDVPYPASVVVNTHDDIGDLFDHYGLPGIWIKRGDFHAVHKEDVSFVSTKDEANNILAEYALRGIDDAVVSQHLFGDLVKFYAVSGTDFFYWFHPYDLNHHKYAAYEQINGATAHYPFDNEALKQAAERAAEVLGVTIYGGDAIVQADGSFHIIDLNDWPSFAPCREQAAEAIATHIFGKFSEFIDRMIFNEEDKDDRNYV